MVGRGEGRTRKLMSQYQQSFVFVTDGFPAVVKLRDRRVHLGQQKEKKWPLRQI